MHLMANYVSPELQEAEQNRLYKHGDALIEILAAGDSAPDKASRERMRRLAAESHAEACLALMSPDPLLNIPQENIPRIPRLIIDLDRIGLLPRGFFRKHWDTIEDKYFSNNDEAAAIFEECTQGNFSRLAALEELDAYQVRLDEEVMNTIPPGMPPMRECIELFRFAANVQQAQQLLQVWRSSPDDMKWMTLFQWMITREVPPKEAEMTEEEELAFHQRIIPKAANAGTDPQET